MIGRKRCFDDPDLGPFVRTHSRWRGRIELPGAGEVDLTLPGSRGAPNREALAVARTAGVHWSQGRSSIAEAIDEHHAAGDESADVEPRARLDKGPAEEPRPAFVQVIRLAGRLVVEVGYRVPWDEEHTLGARLLDGRLLELCGSIRRE